MKPSPLKNKTVTSRCFTGKVAFDDDIYLACEWQNVKYIERATKFDKWLNQILKEGKCNKESIELINAVLIGFHLETEQERKEAFFDVYNNGG